MPPDPGSMEQRLGAVKVTLWRQSPRRLPEMEPWDKPQRAKPIPPSQLDTMWREVGDGATTALRSNPQVEVAEFVPLAELECRVREAGSLREALKEIEAEAGGDTKATDLQMNGQLLRILNTARAALVPVRPEEKE